MDNVTPATTTCSSIMVVDENHSSPPTTPPDATILTTTTTNTTDILPVQVPVALTTTKCSSIPVVVVDENHTPPTTPSDATIMMTTTTTTTTNTTDVLPALPVVVPVESPPPSPTRRRVQFGTVVINEHPIIVGCNPAVSSGVPMSIDWDRISQRSMSIQEYETIREPDRVDHSMLLKDSTDRYYILQNLGYSYKELRDAEKAVDLIRKFRQQSVEDYEYDNFMDARDDADAEYQRRLRVAQGRALSRTNSTGSTSSRTGIFSTKAFPPFSTNLLPRRLRERSMFRIRSMTR